MNESMNKRIDSISKRLDGNKNIPMPVTLPDFAFPDAKIAIYCDGYEFHSEREAFQKDRHQSRELQLQGWCVLRFAGTGGSRETTTDAGATPNTSYRRRIRSGSGRGGRVDDTGRVLLPHTVLSSDLWLIRYRLSELTSGGHLDSYTQTEIRERPATSPSAEPTSRSVQEQAERPVPVAMPPVLYALLYLPRGTRPAL